MASIRENTIHAPPLPATKTPTAKALGAMPIKPFAAPKTGGMGGMAKPPKMGKGGV